MNLDRSNDALMVELFETLNSEDGDRMRSLLQSLINISMKLEREKAVGAKPYERSEERKGYASSVDFVHSRTSPIESPPYRGLFKVDVLARQKWKIAILEGKIALIENPPKMENSDFGGIVYRTPFVDREREIKGLRPLLNKKTASLVTVQGRRRIGKSLVKFLSWEDSFFHSFELLIRIAASSLLRILSKN